jgi:hypothetical protein
MACIVSKIVWLPCLGLFYRFIFTLQTVDVAAISRPDKMQRTVMLNCILTVNKLKPLQTLHWK